MFSSKSTFTGSGESKFGSEMHRHVRVIEATAGLGDVELKDLRLIPHWSHLPEEHVCVSAESLFLLSSLQHHHWLASIHLWSSARCRAAGGSLQAGLRTPWGCRYPAGRRLWEDKEEAGRLGWKVSCWPSSRGTQALFFLNELKGPKKECCNCWKAKLQSRLVQGFCSAKVMFPAKNYCNWKDS